MFHDQQYKYRYRNNAENIIGKVAHHKICIYLITM